jgi:hypothetical protein
LFIKRLYKEKHYKSWFGCEESVLSTKNHHKIGKQNRDKIKRRLSEVSNYNICYSKLGFTVMFSKLDFTAIDLLYVTLFYYYKS